MRKASSLVLAALLLAVAARAAEFNFKAEPGPLVKPVEPLRETPRGLQAAPQIPVVPLEGVENAQIPSAQIAAPQTIQAGPSNLEHGGSPENSAVRPQSDPADLQPELDLRFDKRKRVLGSIFDPGPVFVQHGAIRRETARLAEPWRTEAQLKRLLEKPRAAGESFKFTVIGDAEPGRFALWRFLFNIPGVFKRLLVDSFRHGTDFTVQLGDMVSRGTWGNFYDFFKRLTSADVSNPYLTVIGNHDRRKPHGVSDSKVYRTLFGKTDYFFDHGGVRFVTVDSSAGRVTDDQLRWLAHALDTPHRKIVFTHIPPSVIKPWGPNGGEKTWGGFKEGADRFTLLMSQRNVERVYMGHIHGLRFKDFRGVKYVITGGGGSPLFPGGVRNNFHHYLTVEITPDGIRETVHRADGSSFSVP